MNLKSLSLLSAAGMLMTYTINVQAQCEVKYTINSNWGSGATLSVDITNYGAPKTTWELAWNFSNAEKISQLWNGSYTQAGQAVRVKNAGWNGNLNTNQTTNFGFNISMPNGTSLVKPAEFTLDGVKCVGKTSSSVSSSKSSTSVASSARTSVSSSSNSSLASSKRSSSTSSFSCNSQNAGDSAACASRSSLGSSSRSSSSSSSSSSSTPVLANCSGNLTYGPRLLRILTREEYINSVRQLIGVDIEKQMAPNRKDLLIINTQVNGFDNNTRDSINAFALTNFDKLAGEAVYLAGQNNFSTLLNCSGLSAADCASAFTNNTLTKIFRRPATADERAEYASIFAEASTAEQTKTALGNALRTALSSPQFLYRQETGIAVSELRAGNTNASLPTQAIDNDAYVLTPYEFASFLAFTFTGSTPDDELLLAAKNRMLDTDAQIEAQVTRLLGKTSAREHLGKFAERWLETEYNGTNIAPLNFPEFNSYVDTGMHGEVKEYFNHIVLDANLPFSKLLVNNYGIVNETLINFYQLGSVGVNQDLFTKVNFPSYLRQGGLLTSGGFVAYHSYLKETSPTPLALALRNRLLCQDSFPSSSGDLTTLREHPFWQVGFAYQNLDSASRKRTQNEYGEAINSRGVFTGVTSPNDGMTIAFSGAEDLAQKIAPLAATRYCFIEHNFRAAFGTGTTMFDPRKPETSLSSAELSDYRCEKDRLDQAMTSNNMSVRSLLKRLGTLQSARYRKDRS